MLQNLEYRMQKQNEECQMQNREYRMHNAEFSIQDAECRMQNAECRMQNAECRMQNAECRSRHCTFVFGEKEQHLLTGVFLFPVRSRYHLFEKNVMKRLLPKV